MLRDIAAFIRPYRRAAAVATTFVSVTVLINLVPPLLYRVLIDEGIRQGNQPLICRYVALLVATLLLLCVMQLVEEYFTCQFGLVLMNDVRNRLYGHLQRLPLEFFLKTSNGAILNRFTNDLLNVQRVVARTLPSIATNVLMIAFALALMFFLSWKLTVVTLVAIPLYMLFAIKVTRIVTEINDRAMRFGDRLVSTLTEDFSPEGFLFGKLFAVQARRRALFQKLTQDIQTARIQLSLWSRANNVAADAVQSIGVVAIYGLGGMLLADKDMTLGTIVAFATIAARLYQPIVFFSSSVIDLPTAVLSLERINEFLHITPQRPSRTLGAAPSAAPGEPGICLRVEGLGFTYPGAEPDSGLRDVSFAIRKGERVAIVGANGSGKTTLVMVLAGIHQVDQGGIYLGTDEIGTLSQQDIASRIAVGQGQAFFLNASIKDNLLAVKPDATEAELLRALRRADCLPFVEQLPQGLDTPLGQSGLQLSTGQRQRLSLARLFLLDVGLLVLDESTANLDTESEKTIIRAIRQARPEQTTIVISHSLHTVMHAQRILVLDQGRLVGDGSHAELLAHCPEYERLFGNRDEAAVRNEEFV
ncbi:ABC transporter ATP-binding protein [Paraburkholderia sp. Se-20369]|nr:ABC transporter ATP-binding protein [Paraburkholderia sp. Se-20369]